MYGLSCIRLMFLGDLLWIQDLCIIRNFETTRGTKIRAGAPNLL